MKLKEELHEAEKIAVQISNVLKNTEKKKKETDEDKKYRHLKKESKKIDLLLLHMIRDLTRIQEWITFFKENGYSISIEPTYKGGIKITNEEDCVKVIEEITNFSAFSTNSKIIGVVKRIQNTINSKNLFKTTDQCDNLYNDITILKKEISRYRKNEKSICYAEINDAKNNSDIIASKIDADSKKELEKIKNSAKITCPNFKFFINLAADLGIKDVTDLSSIEQIIDVLEIKSIEELKKKKELIINQINVIKDYHNALRERCYQCYYYNCSPRCPMSDVIDSPCPQFKEKHYGWR